MFPFVSKTGGAAHFQEGTTSLYNPLPSPGSDRKILNDSASPGLPHVLLIEKDAAMSIMLRKILAAEYRVEAVGDALEACQVAKIRPPALILIDLCIPGTDNLTLIRAMRADDRTGRLPIIVLTASVHKELLLRCLSAGASNFLLKPFNPAELLRCVRVELQPCHQPAGQTR